MSASKAPPVSAELVSALAQEAERAALEGGRAIFLVGPERSGKSACLAALRQELGARLPSRGTRVLVVSCAELAGRVWSAIDRRLSGKRRMLSTFGRIVVHWLGVIPILGPLLGAITDSLAALGRGRKVAFISAARPATEAARNILLSNRALPLVICIDDLQAAGPEDLKGLHIFLRSIRETRTLLIAAIGGTSQQIPQHLRDLMLEAEYNGSARVLRTAAAGGVAADSSQLSALSEADRDLLALASVEGTIFHAAVLAEVAERDELEVEDELARLERTGIIRVCAQDAQQSEVTTRYAFQSAALAEVLGTSLDEAVRRRAEARGLEARNELGITILVDVEPKTP